MLLGAHRRGAEPVCACQCPVCMCQCPVCQGPGKGQGCPAVAVSQGRPPDSGTVLLLRPLQAGGLCSQACHWRFRKDCLGQDQ